MEYFISLLALAFAVYAFSMVRKIKKPTPHVVLPNTYTDLQIDQMIKGNFDSIEHVRMRAYELQDRVTALESQNNSE